MRRTRRKSPYTRIQNRFTGYTLKDCECRWCLQYQGKKTPCALAECCCAEEKRLAAGHEPLPASTRKEVIL